MYLQWSPVNSRKAKRKFCIPLSKYNLKFWMSKFFFRNYEYLKLMLVNGNSGTPLTDLPQTLIVELCKTT